MSYLLVGTEVYNTKTKKNLKKHEGKYKYSDVVWYYWVIDGKKIYNNYIEEYLKSRLD
jgi:hypothetical protein